MLPSIHSCFPHIECIMACLVVSILSRPIGRIVIKCFKLMECSEFLMGIDAIFMISFVLMSDGSRLLFTAYDVIDNTMYNT